MTKNSKLLLLGLGAAYVLWRVKDANGGPIVWVSPFILLSPGNPSPGGTQGAGDTNANLPTFSAFFGRAFKGPGNVMALPAPIARPGTIADPLGPPNELTRTAQPERPYVGDVQYLPNLGDPNFYAYDYLAITPPDLFWGVSAPRG